MKNVVLVLAGSLMILASCDQMNPSNKVVLNNQIDSVSYAIGMDQGMYLSKGLESFPDSLNNSAIVAGFNHSMVNGEVLFDEATGKEIISAFMAAKKEEEKEAQKIEYSANLEAGQAFIAQNAQDPDVIVTPSGLQYKVLETGNGAMPIDGDRVKVNYEGTLIDGTVFDSSYERGEPIEFNLNQVIPGWTEGLKLMPVGSTYMLYIPQELAYGENVRPDSPIPPFSALVFKVELLDIVK